MSKVETENDPISGRSQSTTTTMMRVFVADIQNENADSVDAATAGQTPVLRCGSVRLEFRYDPRHKRLAVVVREAIDLPDKNRGGSELTEVHLVLLPAKRTRHKTHAKPGVNPTFDDNFHFRVPPGW